MPSSFCIHSQVTQKAVPHPSCTRMRCPLQLSLGAHRAPTSLGEQPPIAAAQKGHGAARWIWSSAWAVGSAGTQQGQHCVRERCSFFFLLFYPYLLLDKSWKHSFSESIQFPFAFLALAVYFLSVALFLTQTIVLGNTAMCCVCVRLFGWKPFVFLSAVSLCSDCLHPRLYQHWENVAWDLRFSEIFSFGIQQIQRHVLDMGISQTPAAQRELQHASIQKGEEEKTNITKSFSPSG